MKPATKRRLRRVAVAVLASALAIVALAAWQVEALVDWAMTPTVGFEARSAPRPPRYEHDADWSALPSREDAADRAPAGVSAIDPKLAPADAFYVHPTSHVGRAWNADLDDAGLNDATDRVATGIQAPAFHGCCAVYAPRYRQANGTAFYRPSADGEGAIELAYADVERAFDAFLARRGATRPFVLAGHSQGSVLAERLLVRRIAGTPLRDRLVVAYLIGGETTVAGLAERAPDVPPCRSAEEVGCVVSWSARAPGFRPTPFGFRPADDREPLCTNPLSWKIDDAPASAEANLGAVFLESDDTSPRRAFADARCDRGTLLVSLAGDAPRDLPSKVLDRVMGEGNYHPIEYQLFFMNLRANAEARVKAFAGR